MKSNPCAGRHAGRSRAEEAAGVADGPKRILVVDDDPSVREMLARVVTAEGYLALPAVSGAEALRIAAGSQVDLVLLDLNMPGKNGWDTFEKLTAENPSLPIIIVTARPNQLFTALGSGVGGLMEKPLDFPVLLRTMQALLSESVESRLARMAGKRSVFHYLPSGDPAQEALNLTLA